MKPNPLESEIEKRVCDYAKKRGCLAYKFTSPSQRSVPDRLFILPGGTVRFVEFKRLGGVPTPAQAAEHHKMAAKGQDVAIIDNVEVGKTLVDGWLEFSRVEKDRLLQPRIPENFESLLG